jgi:hypothetical protein
MHSEGENVEEAAGLNAIDAFLRDEFFTMTLMAAVQRSDVYAAEAPESLKKVFRSELRRKLEEMALHCRTPVAEEAHLENIGSLADYLTKNHSVGLKWESWVGFWQGKREGDLPLAIAANI